MQHHQKEEEREKFTSLFGWCCLSSHPWGGAGSQKNITSPMRAGENTTTQRRKRSSSTTQQKRGEKQPHPKDGKKGSTAHKEREKATPPEDGGTKQHHPKGEGKSSTTKVGRQFAFHQRKYRRTHNETDV